jgi:glycerol-3-phosphate dehydrogenase subunit B
MNSKKDIVIIGSGMSGLSAAHFALEKGLSVAVISNSAGCMGFAPGTLDLCSVYPVDPITYHDSPVDAMKELVSEKKFHPFAKAGIENVVESWKSIGSYFSSSPLEYTFDINKNVHVITAAGTLKPSNLVSRSLKNNSDAWQKKKKTLIIDIKELKNFSSKQVVENLKERWNNLDAASITIEDIIEQNEIHILKLCSLLEKDDFRSSLIEKLNEKIKGHEALGLPEVCGSTNTKQVMDSLEKELGLSVFEIPGPPPTGSGSRLLQYFRDDLITKGVSFYPGHGVKEVISKDGKATLIKIQGYSQEHLIETDNVILATGRFFGGGLEAKGDGLKETVFDISIEAPESRDDWHMDTFLGAPGHPLNSCGLETDECFRPLEKGAPLYENLYAVGSILKDQDWVREKSGTGIAVSTAWKVINEIVCDN